MGILSDEELLLHQSFLGSGYAALVNVRRLVESGLSLVVASTDVQVEIDLLQAYRVNLENTEESATANLLATATRSLTEHIETVSGQSINDYLLLNGLKVSQDYADLSGDLGVTIDPVNIE